MVAVVEAEDTDLAVKTFARGDAGMGSSTGLQPPPDNSKDRRSGGEAAVHRAQDAGFENISIDLIYGVPAPGQGERIRMIWAPCSLPMLCRSPGSNVTTVPGPASTT